MTEPRKIKRPVDIASAEVELLALIRKWIVERRAAA